MSEPNDPGRPTRTASAKVRRPTTTRDAGAAASGKQELLLRIAAHARRLMVEGQFASINAFAKRIGLAQSYVHQVIKGDRAPGFEFMVALHRGLGADANELIDRDPPARWFQPLECHVTWEPKLERSR